MELLAMTPGKPTLTICVWEANTVHTNSSITWDFPVPSPNFEFIFVISLNKEKFSVEKLVQTHCITTAEKENIYGVSF